MGVHEFRTASVRDSAPALRPDCDCQLRRRREPSYRYRTMGGASCCGRRVEPSRDAKAFGLDYEAAICNLAIGAALCVGVRSRWTEAQVRNLESEPGKVHICARKQTAKRHPNL